MVIATMAENLTSVSLALQPLDYSEPDSQPLDWQQSNSQRS
jgi:hypothetical protein